jgi:hypothetical protein
MWLKKLVGASMIITLIGMNAIVLTGFFGPDKSKDNFALTQGASSPPSVTLKANPTETTAGMFSALSWEVTGEVTGCTASGDWSGQKTPFGSESTGRLAAEGTKTYALTCQNQAGASAPTSVTVTVKPAVAADTPALPTPTPTPTTPAPTATVYCSGASPCYGPREVAAHNNAGDCWGYNGTRVISITGFDAAYHLAKSGRGSIEVSAVCGKNLVPSLSGNVAIGGSGQDHKQATKDNADRNMIPYFVGYFDSSKP